MQRLDGFMTNTLFTGDNLYILNGLNSESVDLIYLDPPFNSKRTYSAPVGSKSAGASFKDMWTWQDVDEFYLERLVDYPFMVEFIQLIEGIHGKPMMSYITYMAQRIIEMHRVLKSTGSLYLHVDPTASHYLKIIMDKVFGKNHFRNEIVWHYYNAASTSKKFFGRKHDIILCYSKGAKNTFNVEDVREPYAEDSNWLKTSGYAKDARYKPNPKGKLPHDVWRIPTINNMAKERLGYPTQKPLKLLERIVKASSDEGDVILDPFCGCATTMVAAQQLQRRWIGVDIEVKAVDILLQRLSDDAGLFSDFVHRTDTPQRTDITQELPDNQSVKARLYKLQGALCNGCEDKLDMRHFEIDHIIPKSKGGGNYYENYQLLCGNCNRVKGNQPMEFLRLKIKKRQEHLKYKATFGD